MKYHVDHKTKYTYSMPVLQSYHTVHLAPRNLQNQLILEHSLMIDPTPGSTVDFFDHNYNPTSIIIINKEHSELQIQSQILIDVSARQEQVINVSPKWEDIVNDVQYNSVPELKKFITLTLQTQPDENILEYANASFYSNRPIHEAALDLTHRIHNDFIFDNTATDATTALRDVMAIKRGVCQDFAHLQIACLRALQIPAKYVSGYLMTVAPDGMEKLKGSDASHAWISVWCGKELGWIDIDPTNNVIPFDKHITVAHGLDYNDVSPINGVLVGGGDHTITVAVDVVPIE